MAVRSSSSFLCGADKLSTTAVFEELLPKDMSDESDLSRIAIKFALAAKPREGVNADGFQVTDALSRATEGVNALSSTPRVVGLMGSGVDTGTNVGTNVQTFDNTWSVLLDRMKLFDQIVTNITQVLGIWLADSFLI